MFEAVLSTAVLTADANGVEGVDVCFARRIRALCCGQQGGFPSRCAPSRGCGCFPASGGPFACSGAFVPGLGAMFETVGAFAGFAAEGEEVELVAVGVLAMGADGFEIFFSIHCCEGLRVGGRGDVC